MLKKVLDTKDNFVNVDTLHPKEINITTRIILSYTRHFYSKIVIDSNKITGSPNNKTYGLFGTWPAMWMIFRILRKKCSGSGHSVHLSIFDTKDKYTLGVYKFKNNIWYKQLKK